MTGLGQGGFSSGAGETQFRVVLKATSLPCPAAGTSYWLKSHLSCQVVRLHVNPSCGFCTAQLLASKNENLKKKKKQTKLYHFL